MLGETIDDRYRILRLLGKGGMGAVYEAEHTGTGRRVALKVIHGQTSAKTEMVTRFQREARAAGSIETPHIVQVLDTGIEPRTGMPYMAMELLHGEDIQALLKRLGKLPPDLALRLVGQACVGLGKAHEAGVIHRDIKPANLFLSRLDSGEIIVKVVDFGIAKRIEPTTREDETLTRTGGMLGSPAYMSPEQAMGRKTIDHRTDIWSLGVVLYKAMAGHAPHADSQAELELILAICNLPTPPVQDAAPWVSADVARLVHRMVARAPDDRFQSMAAVLEAILPHVPGGLAIQADDLVPLGEAEQAYRAPRAVLDDDTVIVRAGQAPPSNSTSAPSLATAEAGLSVSQGAVTAHSRSPRSPLFLVLAAPLVLALGALGAYKLNAPPAVVAVSIAPIVEAPAPSPSAAPPPVIMPAPPPDERTVRLSVQPVDATVEVDGRAMQLIDGSVELRGVIGSVHHVRLVKGALETVGEVAITSLGAVPPRMQMEPAAQKLPVKPPSGKADAGPGAPAVSTPVSRPAGPAPAENFE